MSTMKKPDLNSEIVLVDKKDNVLGFTDKLDAHKKPFPLHRAISVLIFDPSGKKLLIQKRSKFKPTWPMCWSNTCCTHPRKGESYLTCAKRRLKEEMGINCRQLKKKFKFVYKTVYDDTYGEHELDSVFIGEYKGKIKLDPKEVAAYKWVEAGKLVGDVENNPDKYTPWFKIILRRLEIT